MPPRAPREPKATKVSQKKPASETAELPLFAQFSSAPDHLPVVSQSEGVPPGRGRNNATKDDPVAAIAALAAASGNDLIAATGSLLAGVSLPAISESALRASEPPPATTPANRRHWTVTELTQEIRGVLEPSFRQVWVKGEVSEE